MRHIANKVLVSSSCRPLFNNVVAEFASLSQTSQAVLKRRGGFPIPAAIRSFSGSSEGGWQGRDPESIRRTLTPVQTLELTPEEKSLRQKILAEATLNQSTKGTGAMLDETKKNLEKLLQMQPGNALDKHKMQERDPPPKIESMSALLKERLKMGPMPVSEYMALAMTHPEHGYYVTRDVFGSQGDFTTAPEISQLFGELIGVWVVWVWQSLGQPSQIQLIELGPGKGTMMSDLLRATKSFKDFQKALSVHMVEVSPVLQSLQRQKLGGAQGGIKDAEVTLHDGTGVPIRWHSHLADIPINEGAASIILCQEFFDVMPVRQFIHTEKGWCEKLVVPDDDGKGGEGVYDGLKFALSPGPTAASKLVIESGQIPGLPKNPKIGDGVEASPEGWQMASQIGQRVRQTGGAALIIDYGNDGFAADTLQAIKDHKPVHPLFKPGECDLTAHVDFRAVKEAALSSTVVDDVALLAQLSLATQKGQSPEDSAATAIESMEAKREAEAGAQEPLVAHGPVSQNEFLHGLGIRDRIMMLLEHPNADEEKSAALVSQYERLCSPEQMGTLFKVMAITSSALQPGSLPMLVPPEPTEAPAEDSAAADAASNSSSASPPASN